MLGDWWADKLKGQTSSSIRFNIEQGIVNSAYIHNLTLYFNKQGYCTNSVDRLSTDFGTNITPNLVKKQYADKIEHRFNYRLTFWDLLLVIYVEYMIPFIKM